MIIGNANQFTESAIEKILVAIKSVGGKVLSPTVSLCHHCHYHVPAYRYELNNKIYMCKHCIFHGIDHQPIEGNAEFYYSLQADYNTEWNFDQLILTEVTDRCNLECPHCYHLPDNKIKDVPLETILERFKQYPDSIKGIILAGAESSLRKDIVELAQEVNKLGKFPAILTNGVRFADAEFVKKLAASDANALVHIGLNHPSYINNETIRNKQIQGIRNINEYMPKGTITYIGYTMVDLSELDFILNEICFGNLGAESYRIRSGSEIGRNATDGHIFVSNVVEFVRQWAAANNQSFSVVRADNNIYHTVVDVSGKLIRLIHWCDETNIDMEELKTGPYCDFVPDGITNFLHQVIRRDVWKNKNIILPDSPPLRYRIGHQNDLGILFKD
jgi:hypothetical protein